MRRMIAILLLTVMLTGCGANVEKASENTESRFIEVEETLTWKVVADKETGVMYAVSDGGYSHGIFTLLVDENGKPLIWEGDSE